ncbi:DJ-1/PfpI family protein [Phytohabitans rumicis]|uniref:DJ-1/PfpI domain-containing protein n=1 Tax=Phytohabitans rumicis TaxID=1076125 RepID=A0A6V8LGI9_9ACTN|nr:DJ-1/PfpI family protein [Phytohabitans rumicis]GFJ94008.1 hypothetical protein Prum_076500 [Phytohabitans rumicis]
MTDKPLSGARVAVLVESQYIPSELRIYQERFAQYGATVDLVSRLWGNDSLRFYSTVEPDDSGSAQPIEWVEVGLDVDEVDPTGYDAVIAMANYTTVRLRYVDPPPPGTLPAAAVRSAPAVRFFQRAMADPRVVKAAPCHALWLLTPSPELLAGRRVICHPVVLADVLNAGATYVPPPPGTPEGEQVVVDGDLVTSSSWHATERLVDAVRDGILAARERPVPQFVPPVSRERTGKVLMVVSEWGYWGEELVGPLRELDAAGIAVDFVTPTGKRPNAIPVSMDADFFDPPLQRKITSEQMARWAREMDDPFTEQGARLDYPINLADWFPERPYHAAPQFVRLMEVYHRDLARAAERVAEYDAILLVGGAGAIVDLGNNQRVHDLVLAFHRVDKPIAAVCYGGISLAFARDMNERRSILAGKHVTGHCVEYDYKDGTVFVEGRNKPLDFNMGPAPYTMEFLMRDATAPGGAFHGNFGRPTSVIVDYPFITGRSIQDSALTGQKLIEVLREGLRRWGW